ncbi:MAG: hypothetical protein ABI426_02770 [Flavobacterium sp.]
MKKLLSAVLLLSTITLFAQKAPTGYDGGSELQKAILKAKSQSKTKGTKKSKTTHKIIVTELQPPEHTREEAQYYVLYREESPSYMRKLVTSDFWKQKEKVAEQAELVDYDERVAKHKKDSIADEELRKQNVIAMAKIRKDTDSIRHRQDSISKKEREDYLQRIREDQKKNRRPSIFNR